MKKILSLFILVTVMLSCKTAAPQKPEVTNMYQDDFTSYFVAAGNEPFWNLKIGKEETVFKSLIEGAEKITFPTLEPAKAMDANLKMYTLNNSTYSVLITISKRNCEDSMSGIVSPYSVQIAIKNVSTGKLDDIKGCGRYLTDYRLHDIWVLEELNGEKVTTSDFQKELPRIEIYAAENKFMGFGGCNSISGNLFFEKDLLRFKDVISTMMACSPNNKEDEFVKTLQNTTSYSIGNNRLSLSNNSGRSLIFRKVD